VTNLNVTVSQKKNSYADFGVKVDKRCDNDYRSWQKYALKAR
jgi:hypothetical protein